MMYLAKAVLKKSGKITEIMNLVITASTIDEARELARDFVFRTTHTYDFSIEIAEHDVSVIHVTEF